jgi:LacI family transcriptional regulator
MPPLFRESYGFEGILSFAKKWGAHGIIGQFHNSDEINTLIDAGIFLIAVDFREKFDQITNISGDYLHQGTVAADYFISKGFSSFAFYGTKDTVWSREREKGFKAHLNSHGFTYRSFSPDSVEGHNFWFYSASPLQDWLLSLQKPTAIFSCDDNHSEHLLQAAKLSNSHIPEDFAILGVDDDEVICNFSTPQLSNIQQDEENGGFIAAELMDRMITRCQNIKEDITLSTVRIQTRQSTETLALKDQQVKNVLIYIADHLDQPIHVNHLLKEAGLSRRALEKRFKKIVGRTIYQEIQRQKMKKVVNLLIDSNLSMNEISVLCGYEDNKNLSRIFNSFHHMTPLQYRKKYKFGSR